MIKIDKLFKLETRKDLVVQFESENIGLTVIGREEEVTEFHVKLDFEQRTEEEFKLEDMITTNYDEEKNFLKIKIQTIDNIKRMHANLTLHVPFVTEIISKTENAGISIENLQGIQTATSENGSIMMDKIKGDIVCQSENGPIKILDSMGDVDITVENGAVKLKKCDGNLKINGENGSIKLIGCKGSFESEHENGMVRVLDANFMKATIKNENGGIYYEFNPIEKGQFNFENQNGKIHLIIPDGIPYEIEARNELGNFHIGLEGNYDRKREGNEQILEMVKDAGTVEISAKNENGMISFSKNPHHGKHYGMGFGFDFSRMSNMMDGFMDHVPDGVDREKIRKGIEKAKKKMKKFNFPDISENIQNAMSGVQEEIDETLKKELSPEKLEKAKRKIEKAIYKFQKKFVDPELSEQEKQEVDERSRLKILQMLQDGKITADEAERLLKAMEEKN